MLTIKQISTPADIAAARDLVRELTTWSISLDPETKDAPTFGDLESELATLPGVFQPPTGCFLLAREHGRPVGCVAFAGHGDDTVELKRMYVLPDQRGNGIGLKLVDELIISARTLGTRRIILDSYHTMTGAHRVYRSVGFKDVAAPVDFPEKFASRVVFMEMELTSSQ